VASPSAAAEDDLEASDGNLEASDDDIACFSRDLLAFPSLKPWAFGTFEIWNGHNLLQRCAFYISSTR